jgi:hypothetical protein
MLSDAMQYFHGTGTSAFGPITSTAKSFTGSIATTGVLTITAGAAGAQLLVGDSLMGANISTANGPTIVTGITAITAANGVGTYTVSNPQLSASATILASPNLLGDLLVVGATSQQSNQEIDFGAPNPGTANPFISAFPSLTEKGYSYPPEVVGEGGVQMGVHIVVGGPVYGAATLASIRFDVETGAATGATTIIASRTLTLAQLQVAGAHYWIPVPGNAVLEFLRWNATNSAAVNGFVGSIYSWWGPKLGGEQ